MYFIHIIGMDPPTASEEESNTTKTRPPTQHRQTGLDPEDSTEEKAAEEELERESVQSKRLQPRLKKRLTQKLEGVRRKQSWRGNVKRLHPRLKQRPKQRLGGVYMRSN